MDRSDVITLISETREQDAHGIWRSATRRKKIFCQVNSVTRAEFFEGGRNGLNPEYVFTVFFGDYSDDLTFANSPIAFLDQMPDDHPWMELYKKSHIVLCCGQGAWEDDLLYSTRILSGILAEKGIPHWADYWGFDVNHDWPWWRKQLPYFLDRLTQKGLI